MKAASKASSFEIHPVISPDLVDGRIFSNLISIPITNYNPSKWLKITNLKVISQSSGPDISFDLDNRQILTIAPGQIHSVIATFKFKKSKETLESCPGKDIQGILQLTSNEGSKEKVSFSIRCRPRSGSFLFTFIDHDGSIQMAATIFPIIKGEPSSSQIYPVLLTLHGSGKDNILRIRYRPCLL